MEHFLFSSVFEYMNPQDLLQRLQSHVADGCELSFLGPCRRFGQRRKKVNFHKE